MGFLNMLEASRVSNVKKFVYAASSAIYGDSQESPKKEEIIGASLSPYALTKSANELYAAVYKRAYDYDSIGLRY